MTNRITALMYDAATRHWQINETYAELHRHGHEGSHFIMTLPSDIAAQLAFTPTDEYRMACATVWADAANNNTYPIRFGQLADGEIQS